VIIPKIYNGRNKLFWFFTYNAFKDVKTEDPSTFNRTVPTAEMRNGDFSPLLNLPNSAVTSSMTRRLWRRTPRAQRT
jgi:hypothetical protein